MEEQVIIDDQEMAEFISKKLLEGGIIVKVEDVLRVLDYELEFLALKGVVDLD